MYLSICIQYILYTVLCLCVYVFVYAYCMFAMEVFEISLNVPIQHLKSKWNQIEKKREKDREREREIKRER